MKRSRIILGMATLVVAAFGAFAFTSGSSATSAWYFNSNNICTDLEMVVPCDPDEEAGCEGDDGTPAAGQQLYNKDCQIPLRPEQGF